MEYSAASGNGKLPDGVSRDTGCTADPANSEKTLTEIPAAGDTESQPNPSPGGPDALATTVRVVLPDEPPVLTPDLARVLLRILWKARNAARLDDGPQPAERPPPPDSP